MKTDFIAAINQVSNEKGVSKDVVIEAIEAALVSAYKRNFGGAANQDVIVRLNRQSGDVHVFVVMQVVEEAGDPRTQMSLPEARKIDPAAAVGGMAFPAVRSAKVPPGQYSRAKYGCPRWVP